MLAGSMLEALYMAFAYIITGASTRSPRRSLQRIDW
jgi:hypothetical protein